MKPRCAIDGCEKPRRTRGWCPMHYERYRTHGTPHREPKKDYVRFWEKVQIAEGCWLWRGSVSSHTGYGMFWDGQTMTTAHRWLYRYLIDPTLGGGQPRMTVDHTCHNGSGCPGNLECLHRRCVRPDHLELVTVAENIRRGNRSIPAEVCHKGHRLAGEGVYVSANGRRTCRVCALARGAAYRRRKRGARADA